MSSRKQPAKRYRTHKGKGRHVPDLDDTESEVDSDDELDIRTVTAISRGMASSGTVNRKRIASKTKPKARATKARSKRPAPKRKVSKAKSKAAAPKYKRMSSPAVKTKTTPEDKQCRRLRNHRNTHSAS
jgi:hypothetical protein